jgi:hypothetical protein
MTPHLHRVRTRRQYLLSHPDWRRQIVSSLSSTSQLATACRLVTLASSSRHIEQTNNQPNKQINRYRVRAVGEVVALVMPYGNFVECFRGREGTKLREAFKRHREPVLTDSDIATAVLGRSSGSGTTTTAPIRRTLGRRHSDPGYLPSIQERRGAINSTISRTIGGGGGGSGVGRGGRGGSGGVGGSGVTSGSIDVGRVGRQHHSGVTSGSIDVVPRVGRTTDRVPSASAARGRRPSSATTSTHRSGRLSSTSPPHTMMTSPPHTMMTSPPHTMMTSFGADVRGRSDLEADHASDLVLREERRAIFHPLVSVGSEVSDKPETTKVCSTYSCCSRRIALCVRAVEWFCVSVQTKHPYRPIVGGVLATDVLRLHTTKVSSSFHTSL